MPFNWGNATGGAATRQKPHPAYTHGAEFPTGCPTSSARMPESSPHVYTRDRVSDELPHLECPDARKLPLRVHAGCTFHRRGSSLACQRGERAGARGPCRKPRGGRAHGAGLPAGTPGPRPHLDPRAASRATRTGESVALERSWFHRPARAAPPRVVGCPRPLPEHLSARGWREAPAGPFFDRPAGNELPAWALTSGPRRQGGRAAWLHPSWLSTKPWTMAGDSRREHSCRESPAIGPPIPSRLAAGSRCVRTHREPAAMGQEADVSYEFPPGETPDEGHPRGPPPMGNAHIGTLLPPGSEGGGNWRLIAPMSTFARFPSSAEWRSPGCRFIGLPDVAGGHSSECTRRAFAAKRGIPHDTPDPDAWETARSGRLPSPGHPAIRPLLCHSPSFALTHRHVAATIPEGPRAQSHAKQRAGRTQWIRPAPAVVALLAQPAIGWRTSSDNSPGRRRRSRARPTRGCRGTSGWS